ncbi:frizzled-5-like isoform X2 [Clavelina lepadiformis]|uniref:frizzled-5-like isoform X2 n=1 Tax=Clavelina lepadiformis TaxID=159417 RepID=UPI0040436B0E
MEQQPCTQQRINCCCEAKRTLSYQKLTDLATNWIESKHHQLSDGSCPFFYQDYDHCNCNYATKESENCLSRYYRHCTIFRHWALRTKSYFCHGIWQASFLGSYKSGRLKSRQMLCGNQKFSVIMMLLYLLGTLTSVTASLPAEKSRPMVGGATTRHRHPRCETLHEPMCKDIGYNLTDVTLSPANIFRQSDAAAIVVQFRPLMRVNCSEEMILLVCSIYMPICMPDYDIFLPPCRFICERARKGCGPLFEKYRIPWPEDFQCEKFPEFTGDNQMCVSFNRSRTPADNERPSMPRSVQSKEELYQNRTAAPPGLPDPPYVATNGCECTCIPPMVTISGRSDPLFYKVQTGGVLNCAMPCKSPYFSEDRRKSAQSWITAWSVVCFTVTLVTVSTFLIDTERFKYPERPIIFLSACYMFVSVGFLLRVVAGHEAVACAWNSDHVLYSTTGPFLCSMVFLLVYFFGMAGALWWVILSLTWFLAAGLKWGSEAIASYSQYYHAAAWLIPALKSITVLAMSRVDGDSLSGICYVGNESTSSLRAFVIAPLLVYLVLGALFLFLGFLNLFRIRTSIKKVGKKADTLEKLMGRIGLFSLLYMIPSAALLACYFYELQNRRKWSRAYNCRSPATNARCLYSAASRPEFAVFIVKYSMSLIIGITNVVWICTGKTITSWKRFYIRCFGCICGPTGILSRFKTRKMKGNFNTDSSEMTVDASPSSNSVSCQERSNLEGTSDPEAAEEESIMYEFSRNGNSRDDVNTARLHGLAEQEINSPMDVKRKNETRSKYLIGESPNISDYSAGQRSKTFSNGSISNYPCSQDSCCKQMMPSGVDLNNDGMLYNRLIQDSLPPGMSYSSSNASKHHPTCTNCQYKYCQLPYPHSCHSKRSMNGRPLSRQLSNHSEIGVLPCCMYCDQSLALLENGSSNVFQEGDPALSKIQHIHHHHHLDSPCSCQGKGHRRTPSLKHRHSSHDSSTSRSLLLQDPLRKFRSSPPADRSSPVNHTPLRR